MKRISLLAAFFVSSAFAGSVREVSCWNGYSQNDQNKNLQQCKRQRSDGQKCSTNLWEHKRAAYDVCLLEPAGELKSQSCWKGFNQREQNANLSQCLSQEGQGQFCITNMFTHGQAAYDVCLMESK